MIEVIATIECHRARYCRLRVTIMLIFGAIDAVFTGLLTTTLGAIELAVLSEKLGAGFGQINGGRVFVHRSQDRVCDVSVGTHPDLRAFFHARNGPTIVSSSYPELALGQIEPLPRAPNSPSAYRYVRVQWPPPRLGCGDFLGHCVASRILAAAQERISAENNG